MSEGIGSHSTELGSGCSQGHGRGVQAGSAAPEPGRHRPARKRTPQPAQIIVRSGAVTLHLGSSDGAAWKRQPSFVSSCFLLAGCKQGVAPLLSRVQGDRTDLVRSLRAITFKFLLPDSALSAHREVTQGGMAQKGPLSEMQTLDSHTTALACPPCDIN